MRRDLCKRLAAFKKQRLVTLTALVSLLLLIRGPLQALGYADDDPNHYRVPLVAGWYVERPTTWDKPFSPDAFVITNGHGFEETSPKLVEFNEVRDVKMLAISGSFIVGETKAGYFLLNTADGTNVVADKFNTSASWQAALVSAGITNVQLQTPDVLASKLPAETLRPWNYNMMSGLLGLDDGTWSGLILNAGIGLVFLIGCLNRRKRFLAIYAIVVGVPLNVIANGIIAGTGPDTFVGFVSVPFVYFISAFAGFGVRTGIIYVASRRRKLAV